MKPITNRAASGNRFELPADGWIPLVENGETPIRLETGETVVQVVDVPALTAMIGNFNPADKSSRIDFDHFSYEPDKSSEAAGWSQELEIRNGELMARPRWSDTGEAALVNGRFRFISPAFDPSEVEELGRDGQGRRRIRPLRLDSAGLTNNPNMRGLAPLSNRTESPAAPAAQPQPNPHHMKQIATKLGLVDSASEDACVAEISKLLTRLAEAEAKLGPVTTENTTLKNRVAAFDREQIDALLDEHGVKDQARRDKLAPVLLPMKNREERKTFLGECVKPDEGTQKEAKKPLTNRQTAKEPGAEANQDEDRERAEKIKGVIATIRNRDKCDATTAMNRARAEQPALFQ